MVKTKNNVIRTFCFYSAFHVLCTKDCLKDARLDASFDSVSRLFHMWNSTNLLHMWYRQGRRKHCKNGGTWMEGHLGRVSSNEI